MPWFQNGQKRQNRTKNDELLLVTHVQIFSILKIIQGLVIKVRHFWSDFDVFGHFGIRAYGLINRILILGWLGDLKISASSTVRPKLRRPGARPRMASVTSNLVCDLQMYPHSHGSAVFSGFKSFKNKAHSTVYYWNSIIANYPYFNFHHRRFAILAAMLSKVIWSKK